MFFLFLRSLIFRQERLQMSLTYLFADFFFFCIEHWWGVGGKLKFKDSLSPSPSCPFAEAEAGVVRGGGGNKEGG